MVTAHERGQRERRPLLFISFPAAANKARIPAPGENLIHRIQTLTQ